MSKLLLFFSLIFCVVTNSFSQKIIRSSFSSFGNATHENGITFRQTVGQASSTTSVSNNSTSLRQGFQQPLSASVSNSRKPKECTLYLSPNPATDVVNIRFGQEIGENEISIFDMMGKLHLKVTNIVSYYQLDASKLPAGIYLVTVVSKLGYRCNQKLIII
jgi:hypothetical protein